MKIGDRVSWIETHVRGLQKFRLRAQGKIVFLSKTGPRAGVENQENGERTLRMLDDFHAL